MKILFKIAFALVFLFLILAALLVGCVFTLEKLAPGIAYEQIKAATGYRLDIGKFKISLVNGSVEIKDLNLRNPEEWPEENCLKINRAIVDIDPGTMLKQDRVIEELALDVDQICLVTDKDGNTNLDILGGLLKGSGDKETASEAKEEESVKTDGEKSKFLIKTVTIKASKLRIADYRRSTPKIDVIDIGLDLTLHDVTDFDQLKEQVLGNVNLGQILLHRATQRMFMGGNGSDDDGK